MATKQQLVDKIAAEIKTWSISQVDLWRQIPSLAIDANYRGGSSNHLQHCYYTGYWRLYGHGIGDVFTGESKFGVDCETGRLVYPLRFKPKLLEIISVNSYDVLLLAPQLNRIDAGRIIAELRADIIAPRPAYISEEEWEEE